MDMKQRLNKASFVLLGILSVFDLALAQVNNISPEMIQQYQRQVNSASNVPDASGGGVSPAINPESVIQPQTGQAPSSALETPAAENNIIASDEALPEAQTQAEDKNIPSDKYSQQIIDPVSPQGFKNLFYLAVIAAIISAFFGFEWWRRLLKKDKKRELPAEDDGTVCKTCSGSGKVEQKRKKTVDCGSCKKTGRELCKYCNGTGRYGVGLTVPETEENLESYMKCDYCGGTGFMETPLPCSVCKGNKKIEIEESYQAACPACKGIGRTSELNDPK